MKTLAHNAVFFILSCVIFLLTKIVFI